MKITNVKIRINNEDSRLKGIAAITLDDCFVVHDIKVVEGYKGLFIAMPSRKCPDGEFKDIAHPIEANTRQMINTAILAEYEKAVKNYTPKNPPQSAEDIEETIE